MFMDKWLEINVNFEVIVFKWRDMCKIFFMIYLNWFFLRKIVKDFLFEILKNNR